MFDNRRALKFNEFLVKSCQLSVKMANKFIKILEI
jgi:hypothetical protein